MQLTWKDYLALNAPYVALALLGIVGAIYTVGFEGGKQSILRAATVAQTEGKGIA
jgi:hypothetical protein